MSNQHKNEDRVYSQADVASMLADSGIAVSADRLMPSEWVTPTASKVKKEVEIVGSPLLPVAQ
ncbi:MAG: hypothetical protein QNJ45_25920 [Ardenticatenaceae bacterium]|nr:hypothetical protein [Ardenticatenaceae bacterium]